MSIRANIDVLTWESEFFGRKIGKLAFTARAPLLKSAASHGFDLVQAKVAAGDSALLDALLAINFKLVAGEVDFLLKIDATTLSVPVINKINDIDVEAITAQKMHLGALKALVCQQFSYSRFREPWFSLQEQQRFYATWIEKAVLGTFDHTCLLVVTPLKQQILGFVTLRPLAPVRARVGLLGVAPHYSGQGIGKLLLILAQNWCKQQQISELSIATQLGNLPALKLYSRYGASIAHTDYWLYREDSV